MRCLQAGATDFLAKPVDPNDLMPRLRNALIVKSHHDHLTNYARELEHQVRLRTAELEASNLQVIYCLARAGELRDDTTGQHVLRVGRYAGVLARELGFAESEVRLIGLAAQLHDVGKIGIPDAILNKPGKLTTEEFSLMQTHCKTGEQIARPLSDEESRGPASGRPRGGIAFIGFATIACFGAENHHHPPRAVGWPRLSRRPGRGSHPARRPDRVRGRCF